MLDVRAPDAGEDAFGAAIRFQTARKVDPPADARRAGGGSCCTALWRDARVSQARHAKDDGADHDPQRADRVALMFRNPTSIITSPDRRGRRVCNPSAWICEPRWGAYGVTRARCGSSAGFTYVIANGPLALTATTVAPFATA